MRIDFIAQPAQQLGNLLEAALASAVSPTRVVLVSAFASRQAVLRLKRRLHELHTGGTAVRVVVGVDMGGTSKEVLQELSRWPFEVFVFKNRKSGVTFHPKLYLVEAPTAGEIFLGSNNLTEGGLYRNYEGAVQVSYSLPDDAAEFATAKNQLSKFIEPGAPIGRILDNGYLQWLVARNEIPSEVEIRQGRRLARGAGTPQDEGASLYGFEPTAGPPQLPLEVQQVVIAAVRSQIDELKEAKATAQRIRRAEERKSKKAAAPGSSVALPVPETQPEFVSLTPLAQIAPTAFYLELTATEGKSSEIPGEQRIPLEAVSAAQDFWGWPDNYVRSVNPRKGEGAGGEERVYFNWKPVWRVRSISDAAKEVINGVRMYFYQNSSDFRFYSGALVGWAKAGDFIRITRGENQPYTYDCALAIAGTPEHAEWKSYCPPATGRSPRLFGFS
ncbi:phospholipase D-like domain-containing protein [Burkholderia sp. Bp9142]|uniref:phospholipase D-like domain-containing protein n=1 Tax=Burkholderia sp. Bp9142 TaxID=2184573 RepID=UPI000F5AD4F7|nr:phospholipase D family protein [Burkholderia sp. Bp9142]RQR34801.1 hypothetical protein DIE22_16050 [Burkholderia sp. Bp9142]